MTIHSAPTTPIEDPEIPSLIIITGRLALKEYALVTLWWMVSYYFANINRRLPGHEFSLTTRESLIWRRPNIISDKYDFYGATLVRILHCNKTGHTTFRNVARWKLIKNVYKKRNILLAPISLKERSSKGKLSFKYKYLFKPP